MSKDNFIKEMEELFGTEKALGISFITDDKKHISIEEFDSMEIKPGCYSIFPDGSSAICCTDYAAQIYRKLFGRVQIFGFANEDNPTSKVARDQIHPGGHDFAIVDKRYVIDPWIRLVAGFPGPIVFDMHDKQELDIVIDIYGPSSCWKHMTEAESLTRKTKCHSTK